MLRRYIEQKRWVWLLAIAVAVMAASYYAHGLMRWLAYDDEGGYLYAAWRISLGEAPYRDFLTPQLPVFLYPGAAVLALSNYSVYAARFSMIIYTVLSGLLVFWAARRIMGPAVGLMALGIALVHQEVYWAARYFRPEAPMLFWGLAGLGLLLASYPRRRRWGLALSGAALGLATMSKLFGALMMAGVGLFLLAEAARTRDWRDFLQTGLWLAVPFGLIVLGFWGAFSLVSDDFTAAVLGHHLRQGRGTPPAEVVGKGLRLYWDYVSSQAVLWGLAFFGVVATWKESPERRIFIYQVPTMLAFLAMSRDLQARHFTYVVPSLSICAAMGLGWLLARARKMWPWRRGQRVLVLGAAALLFGVAKPQIDQNARVARWGDATTADWVAYVQGLTEPSDYVISDYPGINFFARRPTTRLAAGISRGAAQSGQIMGVDLIAEIEASQAPMVLLNVAQGAHQFSSLQDYEAFKRYVQENYVLIERKQYDYRLMEVYLRDDAWAGEIRDVRLGDRLALTGVFWEEDQVAAGGQARAHLRWQSLADMTADYAVTLRLLDDQGNEWGLGSKALIDIDRETYWDERGLERAVRIPTSDWPLHEQTIDHYELPVDAATPPGTYWAVMRVHQQGSWTGLLARDAASDSAATMDVPLGRLRVLPALEGDMLSERSEGQVSLAPSLVLLAPAEAAYQGRPGDTIRLALYWDVDGQSAARQVTVWLQTETRNQLYAGPLLGPNAEPEQILGVTRLKSQYALRLPSTLEAGVYDLWLEVERGEATSIGRVTVMGEPRVFDVPAMQHKNGALASGVARLLGNDLDPQRAGPGDEISVVLYWQCQQAVEVAYTVFVHLMDEATQQVVAQHDGMPGGGESPTTSWVEGQVITDIHNLRVPAETTPGTYTIQVGLYDATTGVRVPLYDPTGARLSDDRLLIDTLEIGP